MPTQAIAGTTSAVTVVGKALTTRKSVVPKVLPEQPGAVAVNVYAPASSRLADVMPVFSDVADIMSPLPGPVQVYITPMPSPASAPKSDTPVPTHAGVGDTLAVTEDGNTLTAKAEEKPTELPEQAGAVAVKV